MKFAKSKKQPEPDPETEARFNALMLAAERDDSPVLGPGPIVLMTRIRLARNLAQFPFNAWARESQRSAILSECLSAIQPITQMRRSTSFTMNELNDLQKQLLVERHLISRELSSSKEGSGVIISRDQVCAIMVNEEDHLRMQVIRPGFQLKRAWNTINTLDTAIESRLEYAFSHELGYLTACPTNLGTGMRASAMMHLPALVMTSQMEKVVRAVNQLGLVVRGLHGEGTDASGSIFQISNQTTLGEREEDIIRRLHGVLKTIIEQEMNAREKLLENEPYKLWDKIGRAYGLLHYAHTLNSTEALNLLSLMRLGIDLRVFPEEKRALVDHLVIRSQPAHIQVACKSGNDAAERDVLRADLLRKAISPLPKPDFTALQNN